MVAVAQWTTNRASRLACAPLLLMIGSSHVVAEVARERPELNDRHPGIRWREVYGFRNIAAHVYLDIVLERVWRS